LENWAEAGALTASRATADARGTKNFMGASLQNEETGSPLRRQAWAGVV
jgi:hypothetical protein